MKTDDLIEMLARREGQAHRRSMPRLVTMGVLGGAAIGAMLLLVTKGVRADIGVQLPVVFAKTTFSAVFAMLGLWALVRLMRPGASMGVRLWAGVATGCAALTIGAIVVFAEPPDQRLHALTQGVFPWCLVLIPLFGAPTAAALAWVARTMAPTRLAITGAAIGGAAGGIGAVIYAMHCPIDSVVFVSVWYAISIGLSAALGAVLGSWLLRW